MKFSNSKIKNEIYICFIYNMKYYIFESNIIFDSNIISLKLKRYFQNFNEFEFNLPCTYWVCARMFAFIVRVVLCCNLFINLLLIHE